MQDSSSDHNSTTGRKEFNNTEKITPVLSQHKGVLNPVDRVPEILFGLIMTLSFTCTISVAETGRSQIKSLLFAAIGANIAWGLVDAVMYVLTSLAQRGHDKSILSYLHKADEPQKARTFIANSLPPVIGSSLDLKSLEEIREGLLKIPVNSLSLRITLSDIREASAVFLMVFFAAIPVALPFVFIRDVQLAIRISNGIAIACMFTCGWLLAGYSGYNKLSTALTMTCIGTILVAITIALGG